MSDDAWMMDEEIIGAGDKEVLGNLSRMGEKLRELKEKVEACEEALSAAKKEYQHWANVVLPQEMYACGIESLTLASGGSISLKRNFYCQPNKNEADRKVMASWLREHGGAHLIVEEAQVGPDDVPRLKEAGIPYVESESVNTNKLKAWLKDGIGVTTGQQRFTIDDIPKCIHFQEVTVADIQA